MELKLTDKQRQDLIQRHRQERDKRVCDRIKAVLAFDDGYSYSEIARLLLLDDETIRRHINDYQQENKLMTNNGGSDSKLNYRETKELIEHLAEVGYFYVKNICRYVKTDNKSKLGNYEHDPFTLYIKIEGKVVGGCYGDVTKDNCYIDCIWVVPQYRKKGLAKSVMSKLEMYAKQKNCTVMTLETADFQAKDFYTKIGFSIIDTYPHNTFLGHQVYLMRKTLLGNISEANANKILEELKSREPIFHHSEKLGKTKQDIENQICDEFWEVGASGNIYTKQDVIETLCERYNDPNYQDIWEAKDFALIQIAADNYLLTYVLIQNKTRMTRRSTIWRGMNGSWKILYHQGTVIDGGGT